jgi:hypothetical protein
MRPGELRRSLRRERRAISRSLRQARKEARAELRQDPSLRKARIRRRVRLGILGAVLLAAALLFHCRCDAPVKPAKGSSPALQAVVAPVRARKPAEKRPPAIHARVEPQHRGRFTNAAPTSPAWLDAFHLQVSARSPRLAACFSGADRPGALRWTASLDPKSGAVSDSAFEPVGATAELGHAQRECAVKVLSTPAYRLVVPTLQGLPARIALVITF